MGALSFEQNTGAPFFENHWNHMRSDTPIIIELEEIRLNTGQIVVQRATVTIDVVRTLLS